MGKDGWHYKKVKERPRTRTGCQAAVKSGSAKTRNQISAESYEEILRKKIKWVYCMKEKNTIRATFRFGPVSERTITTTWTICRQHQSWFFAVH